MRNTFILITCFCVFLIVSNTEAQTTYQKMEPIGFASVDIEDSFWKPRIQSVTSSTIPVITDHVEIHSGGLRNFEKAAANNGGKHEGMFFIDSDVYKVIEAIAYSLKNYPDPELEEKTDTWIDIISSAQMPDGYLNTYYQLGDINDRWTHMGYHECYCAGHLIEAAVAYYQATGKRKLLDVSIRFADHIDSTFRLQGRHWVPGHEEIELALVKLFRTTGEKRYLDLADWFLEQRGHGYREDYGSMIDYSGVVRTRKWYDEYSQDLVPVKDQTEITGHAVRAMYLYTGAADVGAALNDLGYMEAMKKVWEDVVYRNMYITGGIGTSHENEGFERDYHLPNETAYTETCASVGMVFWNNRMNLLTGESKYADILERSLYNGALDGLSLSGDRFFYRNPLASTGNDARWTGLNCCSSNITRLVESVGDYIYARSDQGLWINLFVGSSTTLTLNNREVRIRQETEYPWAGKVLVTVEPERRTEFDLHLRIPGWARNEPVPGDTYHYLDDFAGQASLSVNGEPADFTMVDGYAVIHRKWKKGDAVLVELPMPVRRIVAIEKIEEDRNRVALQRGPLVYCFEHADNQGSAMNIVLPDNVSLSAAHRPELLGGVVVIRGEAPVAAVSADGLEVHSVDREVTAIPYYTWANRDKGEMQVWVPRKITDVNLIAD